MNNYGLLCELIFPTACAGCGRRLGRPICPACNSSLPRIKGPACRRCGRPTTYEVESCLECRGRLKFLEATVALGVYEEPLRSVIHKLKYGNGWRLSRLLGPMLATRLAPFIGRERPLVAHVPMHERKRRVKGYDHARELAECLARSLGLEHRPLLERVRFTASQASLERKGRRTNVAGAFKLKEEWVEETAGRRVVLVDDVLTTGSTVSECARVLVEGGAAGVTACILARDLKAGCGEP